VRHKSTLAKYQIWVGGDSPWSRSYTGVDYFDESDTDGKGIDYFAVVDGFFHRLF